MDLDISKNPGLAYLNCSANWIRSLDVTKNPRMEVLDVHGCLLNELDVSVNPALVRLNCSSTGLQRLDIEKKTELLWQPVKKSGCNRMPRAENYGMGQPHTDNRGSGKRNGGRIRKRVRCSR